MPTSVVSHLLDGDATFDANIELVEVRGSQSVFNFCLVQMLNSKLWSEVTSQAMRVVGGVVT